MWSFGGSGAGGPRFASKKWPGLEARPRVAGPPVLSKVLRGSRGVLGAPRRGVLARSGAVLARSRHGPGGPGGPSPGGPGFPGPGRVLAPSRLGPRRPGRPGSPGRRPGAAPGPSRGRPGKCPGASRRRTIPRAPGRPGGVLATSLPSPLQILRVARAVPCGSPAVRPLFVDVMLKINLNELR